MASVCYVVANDKRGIYEFLAHYAGNEYVSRLVWAVIPDLAKVFPSRQAAEAIVAREQTPDGHLFVCELHDARKHWVVDPLPLQRSATP